MAEPIPSETWILKGTSPFQRLARKWMIEAIDLRSHPENDERADQLEKCARQLLDLEPEERA